MIKPVVVVLSCSLAAALPAQEPADSCTACHKGDLTLEGWDVAELKARLVALRDGESDHVVPIPMLSDEELEALAAALAGH
jgi:hypothetical protein